VTPATTPAAPERTTTPEGAVALTLAPVPLEAFRAEHEERAPLVVARSAPGRFDGVLSLADLDHLVSATGIRTPAFRMVRDGGQVPLGGYTEDVPWPPGAFTGMARPERVAEEYAAGATIVLQALQLHWPPAARFCRGLEHALGVPVQANAYATPAAAQGFGIHHDTHDVFVLQVAGRKRWRWYAPRLELPLGDQKWSDALGDPGEPVRELVLEAGDTLYLPRGWPHAAATGDGESLHITVGLHAPTRMAALRAALDACADDVELRRRIGADGVVPADLLERVAARARPEDVRRRLRRRFVLSRRPIVEDRLAQLRGLVDLTGDEVVERRRTVIADLEAEPPTLVFEGKEIVFPPVAGKAVAAVAAAEGPFAAADLPGPLDEAGRVVLVRRLVREGFLRRVATPAPA
jgi:hypothetical protein